MSDSETIPTNQVVLRFYGRFIYAVANAKDRILALAPNFEEAKFGEHKPLMTVQRDQVIFSNDNTTLPPMLRLATDATILNGEFLVWDVSGFSVTSNVPDGPVSLTVEKGIVMELPKTAGTDSSPTIKPEALQAGKTGLSRTVIKINRGLGVAQPVVDGSAIRLITDKNMEEFRDDPDSAPYVKDPSNPTKDLLQNSADLVEFVVTAPPPSAGTTADFVVTFTFVDAADKTAGLVTVRGGTKVAFSNMCAAPPSRRRHFDTEFREYYNFLSAFGPDRLIPAAPPDPEPGGLIEGADCDVPGIIAF